MLDAARGAGVDVPAEFDELRQLTPFAVEFRYDPLPEEPEAPLDKDATRNAIRVLRAWIENPTRGRT